MVEHIRESIFANCVVSKFQRPREESVSVRSEQSRMPSVVDLLDRASVRLVLILIPVSLLAFLATLFLTPYCAPLYGDAVAREIAAELNHKPPSRVECLDIVHRYGLTWCFATDARGEVITGTASFTPPTRRLPATSQTIEIRQRKFYDAVAPLEKGRSLHVGLQNDTSGINISITSPGTLVRPVPFGLVLFLLLFFLAAAFVICESIVGISIFLLGSSIDKLSALIGSSYNQNDIREATRLTWATAEVRSIASSLNVLMRKVTETLEKKSVSSDLDSKRQERRKKREVFAATGSFENQNQSGSSTIQQTGVFDIQVERVLATSTSSYDFATKLLDSVKTIFSDITDCVAFLKVSANGDVIIEKELGLGADGVELLKRVNHKELTDERSISKRSIEIGPMQIKRLGFEQLARQLDIGQIIYLPIQAAGKIAILAIYVGGGKPIKPERVRALERFRDKVVSIFGDLVSREEHDEERWTDPVSGLGNSTYFQELLPMVMERTREPSSSGTFTIAFIGLDFSAPDLVRFPPEMRPRWMTEVGQVLQSILPVSKRLVPERGANTYLSRHADDVIACVIEGSDNIYANSQIENIRSVLQSRTQWAGGVTAIPFCIGVATFPTAGRTAEEIVRNADRTLSYIKEMKGGTGVMNASEVPADFTPKASTEIAGTLGVLNAADLLQSIAGSENNGVLTVENELGQQFICSWRQGQPMQASLGSFTGMKAVGEFIITFKTGQYNFQQRKPTEAEMSAPSQLHSIEYCLMEAALYEDKMNAAMKVIPNAGIIVQTVDHEAGYKRLEQETDVTPEELQVIQEISRYARGGASLEAIFKKLDRIPSFMKWRAAALMIENGLLEWQWPTM